MADEVREELICVGGPAAGRRVMVDPRQKYHKVRVPIRSPLVSALENSSITDLASESHYYEVMRMHFLNGSVCILIPQGTSHLDALKRLLKHYAEMPS